MQNLLKELTELLSLDDRLVSEGRLMKNKIVELALAVDPLLLRHLLSSPSMCNHFFSDDRLVKAHEVANAKAMAWIEEQSPIQMV